MWHPLLIWSYPNSYQFYNMHWKWLLTNFDKYNCLHFYGLKLVFSQYYKNLTLDQLYLKNRECILLTAILYDGKRINCPSLNIIIVWWFQTVWFISADIWYNGSTSPILSFCKKPSCRSSLLMTYTPFQTIILLYLAIKVNTSKI